MRGNAVGEGHAPAACPKAGPVSLPVHVAYIQGVITGGIDAVARTVLHRIQGVDINLQNPVDPLHRFTGLIMAEFRHRQQGRPDLLVTLAFKIVVDGVDDVIDRIQLFPEYDFIDGMQRIRDIRDAHGLYAAAVEGRAAFVYVFSAFDTAPGERGGQGRREILRGLPFRFSDDRPGWTMPGGSDAPGSAPAVHPCSREDYSEAAAFFNFLLLRAPAYFVRIRNRENLLSPLKVYSINFGDHFIQLLGGTRSSTNHAPRLSGPAGTAGRHSCWRSRYCRNGRRRHWARRIPRST